jgi:hypothetical protein
MRETEEDDLPIVFDIIQRKLKANEYVELCFSDNPNWAIGQLLKLRYDSEANNGPIQLDYVPRGVHPADWYDRGSSFFREVDSLSDWKLKKMDHDWKLTIP